MIPQLPPLSLPLFKYRSLSGAGVEHARKLLQDNEVYFSTLGEFNDPYEGHLAARYKSRAPEEGEVRAIADELKKTSPLSDAEAIRIARQAIQATIDDGSADDDFELAFTDLARSTGGILSLSRVHDHMLMWSHYADSHRGICVEFWFPEEWLGRLREVEYSASFPRYDVESLRGEGLLLFTTKAETWRYEKECRIFDKSPGVHTIPGQSMVRVILGCCISDEHRALVTDWARQRNPTVAVWQCRMKKHEYGLDVVPAEEESYRGRWPPRNAIRWHPTRR